MVEVKLHRDHPASMDERVHKRTRNSGDTAHADHVVKGDKGTMTNIHETRNQQYGEGLRVKDQSPGRSVGPPLP
jgi:hypothetical protein